MSTQSAVDGELFRKLALALGFLSLFGGVLVAHTTPADGYELSLYTATPTLVWAGLAGALGVALAVAFVPLSREGSGTQSIALVLGGLVMAVFAGLPIVRGYRFYGHHDGLTHLGWARAISEGTITPFDLYYPGIHLVTAFINSAVGISISHSLLLVVVLAMVIFYVFVPLSVGTIVRDQRGAVIGAFSAFLLLPITSISMYPMAHAMTQAVLFSSIIAYLLMKYVRTGTATESVSGVGVALVLAAIATVVYHPQLVAHLIVVFVGICALQYLSRRVASGGRMATQTPVYGHALLLIGLFLLWTSNHGFFGGTIEHFFGSAVDFLLGDGGGAGDAVATQGGSLGAIGGSLLEIFFKLFTAHLVYVVLVGGLALGAVLVKNSGWIGQIRAETAYFLVGLVGLVPVFGIYFLAPGTMYFRVFGLMMVFVTILGSVAIHGIIARHLSERNRFRVASSTRPLVAVGFAFLLIVSLVAVFPSPYTYNSSPHVSEQQMDGYESAFTTQDEDLVFVGLRDAPNRHDDAINGNEQRMRLHWDLSESAIEEGLANQSDEDRYLALTQSDYEREETAYQGLRYTEEELDSIAMQPEVNRIQSNGEFDLYYVDAGEE